MKPSAIVIKFGRGETAVQANLIAAQKSGTIADTGVRCLLKGTATCGGLLRVRLNVVMLPFAAG